MPSRTEPQTGRRRAFTLVELLIVIGIIVLLIAILVPALGGARSAARKAQSETLVSSLGQAVGAFGLDHDGQAPGLFSARDMGHSDNEDEGMSAMENMILALSGQDAVLGRNTEIPNPSTSNAVLVGPLSDTDTKYWVDTTLIGSNKDAYFDVSPEYFVAQVRGTQQHQTGTASGHAADEGEPQLPDLVDAWGQPILAWVKDEYGATQIRQSASDITLEREKFVQLSSDTMAGDTNNGPAWFYWVSNAAFLKAMALGKKGYDMSLAPSSGASGPRSFLSSGLTSGGNSELLVHTMAALLGTSGFATLQDSAGAYYDPEDLVPTAARGKVVIHSAGKDGVYLSSKDDGASAGSEDGVHLDFGSSFYPPGAAGGAATRLVDDKGQPTSVDVVGDFDDIIVGAGN